MLELAALLPEVAKIITGMIEDPKTYERAESIRQILEKLTGQEIAKNDVVALLEGVTQGDPFTGEWEDLPAEGMKRMRVTKGHLYVHELGQMKFVSD